MIAYASAKEDIYARANVNVLTAGTTVLQLNNPTALRLWLNGTEIKDPTTPLTLEKGPHTFLLRLVRRSFSEGGNLRLEFTTPSDSPLKLQPEGGV